MKKNVLFVLTGMLLLTGCELNLPSFDLPDFSFTMPGTETGGGGNQGGKTDPDNPNIPSEKDNFTNTESWINKGYASSYEDALEKTANKQNCGLSYQSTTYLPKTNPGRKNADNKYFYISDYNYSEDGNAYRINTVDGSIGPVIYKDCCYVDMEDIAAYMIAFCDVPPNMKYDKYNGQDDAIDEWGVLGRVNHDYYSNDTSSYNYEPELTLQDSDGKYYAYYECDYGPKQCNPNSYGDYPANSYYNNGSSIQRGPLRFCYTHNYSSAPHNNDYTADITNPTERHVFYTYNHYNDFQEYLNYYGGWNTIFGNLTEGNEYNKGPCTQTPTLFERISLADYSSSK